MFTEWKAKLRFPTFREYRRPRRFWLFPVLQHALIDLSSGQIECDEPLVLGMDYSSKELMEREGHSEDYTEATNLEKRAMREWMKEYTDQLPEYNYLLDELLG